MIHIPNCDHDPALNLAAEEYILTSSGLRESVLFFYINDPSVILGRHQNARDEINADYIREHGIRVVRRSSGGGAVYHDRGNLNYSLIFPGERKGAADFSLLLGPILTALREIGVPAELTGRNDLTLDGKKFSGNAFYSNRAGSVIHGTLLFDSDLEVLTQALRPDPAKLASKGIRSVRSRVCCIREWLPQIGNTEELEEAILDRFIQSRSVTRTVIFSDSDLEKIRSLADSKYRNDRWTYGESPAYSFRKTFRRPGGTVDFRADIRGGILYSARFFGDFFCPEDISGPETALTGTAWQKDKIGSVLADAGWDCCFPEFPLEDFLSEVFSSQECV